MKTEKDHNEFYADCWRERRHEWLDNVKNNVLCMVFSYARDTQAIEEFTEFGIEN